MQHFEFDEKTGVIKDKLTGERCVIITKARMIEIVELNLEEAEVKFRIWNNFFAEIRNEESTYCNCVEGFVSGMYEQIMRKPPKVQKTKCVEKGDPYCEWHMT